MGRLAFLLYGGLAVGIIASASLAPQTPQPTKPKPGSQVRTCYDTRVGLYKPCREIWAERDV